MHCTCTCRCAAEQVAVSWSGGSEALAEANGCAHTSRGAECCEPSGLSRALERACVRHNRIRVDCCTCRYRWSVIGCQFQEMQSNAALRGRQCHMGSAACRGAKCSAESTAMKAVLKILAALLTVLKGAFQGACSCLPVVRRDGPAFDFACPAASSAVFLVERGPACSGHRIFWL